MNDATYDGPHYNCGACSSGNWNMCHDPKCATQIGRAQTQNGDPK